MDKEEQSKAGDAGRKLHAFRSLIAYLSGMIAADKGASAYFQYKTAHPEDTGEPEQETNLNPNNNND